LPGINQFTVDVKSLPGGSYSLLAEWNHGQNRKAVDIEAVIIQVF
jgi:hypothetical protein